MMTVNEVSKLTGVSIRALQYYDKIGLLHPAEYTEAGYRLYDDTALERLQQILLFRELEFSLKEIQSILQSPDFDRDRALDQQICLLTLKKEHIENLITFARGLKQVGGMNMDFSAFDTAKMDEYATKAKEKWQHTNAYQEYTQKNKGRSKDAEEALARGLMLIFSDFGKCKDGDPALPEAQALVKRLQAYISENYYNNIKLEHLAKIAGMNEKYFCRYFRSMTERTPIDYLNYYRIECACEMLSTKDISVKEVAISCGFNDESYFIKTFSKYKGITPKQFMKSHF